MGWKPSEGEDEWRLYGECVTSYGERISLFYGEHVCFKECDGPKGCLAARKEKGRVERVQSAKSLCNTCDVKTECLEFALENDEKFGIWGGKTERERRKIKKGRKADAKAARGQSAINAGGDDDMDTSWESEEVSEEPTYW